MLLLLIVNLRILFCCVHAGIIITFGVMGPATAYALGGVFTRIYVTLEGNYRRRVTGSQSTGLYPASDGTVTLRQWRERKALSFRSFVFLTFCCMEFLLMFFVVAVVFCE